VPAPDGLRRHDQPQGSAPLLWDDIEQQRDEGPVSPVHLGSDLDVALQHGELVA
jgi:hypothetical protein